MVCDVARRLEGIVQVSNICPQLVFGLIQHNRSFPFEPYFACCNSALGRRWCDRDTSLPKSSLWLWEEAMLLPILNWGINVSPECVWENNWPSA